MKGKLFCNVERGEPFFYGDNPERRLVKTGPKQALTPEGIKNTNPHVLVFQNGSKKRSIYDPEETYGLPR